MFLVEIFNFEDYVELKFVLVLRKKRNIFDSNRYFVVLERDIELVDDDVDDELDVFFIFIKKLKLVFRLIICILCVFFD